MPWHDTKNMSVGKRKVRTEGGSGRRKQEVKVWRKGEVGKEGGREGSRQNRTDQGVSNRIEMTVEILTYTICFTKRAWLTFKNSI